MKLVRGVKYKLERHFLQCICLLYIYSLSKKPTIVDKNTETNDKFYRKVEFLIYTEMINFRPQS